MTWDQEVAELLSRAPLTQAEAAVILEVRPGTISDWVRGVRTPHKKAMSRARAVLGAVSDARPDQSRPRPTVPAPKALPLAIPQHFASDSDRISFARGVLLMGAETNRITSESGHQVARAIQAAMASLLAPVGLTPTVAPNPTAERKPGHDPTH